MRQIQRAPAYPHLGLISHHRKRCTLQFVHQERNSTCRGHLGPNFTWSASPATQWKEYDPLDVRSHHQGPSQLARCPGEDAAWRSGEGPPHSTTQMAWPCCSDDWLKKLLKLSPGRGHGRGSPTKTWSKMILLDWLELALKLPFR